jgi:hypothetical protein
VDILRPCGGPVMDRWRPEKQREQGRLGLKIKRERKNQKQNKNIFKKKSKHSNKQQKQQKLNVFKAIPRIPTKNHQTIKKQKTHIQIPTTKKLKIQNIHKKK